MEIERLSFKISPPDRVEDFIDADERVWTEWLKQQKGFLRKTYQRYDEGRVDIRIFWASRKDWDNATRNPEIATIGPRLQAEFVGVIQQLPT